VVCSYIHPHACVYTCIYIRIHRYTYIHKHTYAHAHIHACMHTHIHMHVYAHLYTDRKSQQRRLNVSSNTTDAHTYYVSIYICMSIHIYMHIHICAHPAASVLQMCMLMSNQHLYNVYVCTCTSAQKNCSKVRATLHAKKMHIYICRDIHTYA